MSTEEEATPRPTITECVSCAICELSAVFCCPECGLSLCGLHMVSHRETEHGVKMHATFEPRSTSQTTQREKIRERVLEEARKGNLVFVHTQGMTVAPLDEFIKQPAEGILYDLNRLPEVVMTFIDDPKWLNDFAVSMVIRRLREQVNSFDTLRDALMRAEQFIVNGVELGYITMPDTDTPDSACETLPAIRRALATIEGEKK